MLIKLLFFLLDYLLFTPPPSPKSQLPLLFPPPHVSVFLPKIYTLPNVYISLSISHSHKQFQAFILDLYELSKLLMSSFMWSFRAAHLVVHRQSESSEWLKKSIVWENKETVRDVIIPGVASQPSLEVAGWARGCFFFFLIKYYFAP